MVRLGPCDFRHYNPAPNRRRGSLMADDNSLDAGAAATFAQRGVYGADINTLKIETSPSHTHAGQRFLRYLRSHSWTRELPRGTSHAFTNFDVAPLASGTRAHLSERQLAVAVPELRVRTAGRAPEVDMFSLIVLGAWIPCESRTGISGIKVQAARYGATSFILRGGPTRVLAATHRSRRSALQPGASPKRAEHNADETFLLLTLLSARGSVQLRVGVPNSGERGRSE
jgi:hypothetical protein